METITKAQFIQHATKGIDYLGSTWTNRKDLPGILKHVRKVAPTIDSQGHRVLKNRTISSLRFETNDGYSYLDLHGKTCKVHTDGPVFIIVDDIEGTINLIIYRKELTV